jgi:hypothetical protein
MSIGKMMIQQNFLSPTGFRFSIKRLPNVSFFVQAATIPGLSMGVTDSPTPFKTIHFAGDKLQYEQFNITVRVDEYMDSYNEIFDWIVGLSKPQSFDQYKSLQQSDDGLYSDATLTILDSRKNPGIEVTFKDMFPISLGSIVLDTTETDVNYKTCDITFQHNGHTVKKI